MTKTSRLRRLVLAWILVIAGNGTTAAVTDIRDPLTYSPKQYAFILAMAMLGGIVSWYGKVRKGHLAATNLMALIGEMATACFAGLLTFYFCEWMGLAPILTAPIVGLSGHMGAQAITLAEDALKRRAKKLVWDGEDEEGKRPS